MSLRHYFFTFSYSSVWDSWLEKRHKTFYYGNRVSAKNYTRIPWFFIPFLLVGAVFVLFVTTQKKTNLAVDGCGFSDVSGVFIPETIAYFEGSKIPVPSEVVDTDKQLVYVLGEETGEERWIEVDLSDQKLIAHQGDSVFLETKISSGLPWTPTPTGEFRIWVKFKYTKMEGGSGKYYYNLPNVPYVMFFENADTPGFQGYGLHGTYWHNDFGKPHSHGCVNLPTPVAKQLFYWTLPALPDGKGTIRANADNVGTRIVIHE